VLYYRLQPRAFWALRIPAGSEILNDPAWGCVAVGNWACIGPGNVKFVLSDEAFKALSFAVKDITDEELLELKEG
jgi:hypothetical protein